MSKIEFPQTHNHFFAHAFIEFPIIVDGEVVKEVITEDEAFRIAVELRIKKPHELQFHNLGEWFEKYRPQIEKRYKEKILSR